MPQAYRQHVRENLLLAMDTLRTHKFRSFLTVLGVLIGTTTVAPSAALNSAQTYVRPDGQVVGTYAELITAGPLRTGIWQTAAAAYVYSDFWSGYNDGILDLTKPGVAGTNCTK